MSKILFLDIDGVLNSSQFLYHNRFRQILLNIQNDRNLAMVSNKNLFWVSKLCKKKDCKVVLTSSWRYLWDKNLMPSQNIISVDNKLKKYFTIIDRTDGKVELKNNYNIILNLHSSLHLRDKGYWRGTQILSYMENHNLNFDDILIVDDDDLDIACYPQLKKRLIKTSFYKNGFTYKHYKEALNLLK